MILYDRVNQAMLDRKNGRIDVMMSDYIPAQARAKQIGGLEVVYHGVLSSGPVPPWSNEPVSLLKSTAVAFLIVIPELMAKAKSIAAQTCDPIGSYLAVAVVYPVIVYLLDAVLQWLEQTSRIPGFEMEGKKA